DSRMVGADKYLTVQNYSKQCQELLDQFSRQKYGLKLGNRFDLKNVRIVNEIPGDGFYDLLFENHANNFFCEGQVDSSARRMVVVAGSLKDKDKAEPTTMLEMKDTCSMTSGLLGKDELVKGDECKDITGNELTWKHGITGLFSTYVMYVGIKQGWKLYNKLAVSPRFLGFARLPVIRNLGWGAFTYLGYDAIASNFFPEDHPARKYGKWIAGGTGVAAAEILPKVLARSALASRLAAAPIVSRLGLRAIGSRATLGLAAVWATNALWSQFNGNSDYQTSV